MVVEQNLSLRTHTICVTHDDHTTYLQQVMLSVLLLSEEDKGIFYSSIKITSEFSNLFIECFARSRIVKANFV